jgi:predicted  nucleic acid-binding Zn-ribbon protein
VPGPQDIESLRADARYHRERVDLYRAKMYGSRPTSPARFRELERAWRAAEERLAHAEDEAAAAEDEAAAAGG